MFVVLSVIIIALWNVCVLSETDDNNVQWISTTEPIAEVISYVNIGTPAFSHYKLTNPLTWWYWITVRSIYGYDPFGPTSVCPHPPHVWIRKGELPIPEYESVPSRYDAKYIIDQPTNGAVTFDVSQPGIGDYFILVSLPPNITLDLEQQGLNSSPKSCWIEVSYLEQNPLQYMKRHNGTDTTSVVPLVDGVPSTVRIHTKTMLFMYYEYTIPRYGATTELRVNVSCPWSLGRNVSSVGTLSVSRRGSVAVPWSDENIHYDLICRRGTRTRSSGIVLTFENAIPGEVIYFTVGLNVANTTKTPFLDSFTHIQSYDVCSKDNTPGTTILGPDCNLKAAAMLCDPWPSFFHLHCRVVFDIDQERAFTKSVYYMDVPSHISLATYGVEYYAVGNNTNGSVLFTWTHGTSYDNIFNQALLISNITLTTNEVHNVMYVPTGRHYFTFEPSMTTKIDKNLTFAVVVDFMRRPCECNNNGRCFTSFTMDYGLEHCLCDNPFGGTHCEYIVLGDYNLQMCLLTLSNLGLVPAIIRSIRHKYFLHGSIYFFAMIVSAMYHMCDINAHFCIARRFAFEAYLDFVLAMHAVYTTLIFSSLLHHRFQAFTYLFGSLIITCLVTWEIHGLETFLIPTVIGIVVLLSTWGYAKWTGEITSFKEQVPWRWVIGGIVLAGAGLGTFAGLETNSNYYYTHSVWHVTMGLACYCFLHVKDGLERKGEHHLLAIHPMDQADAASVVDVGGSRPSPSPGSGNSMTSLN